jgi:hypothetical protein
MIRRVENVAHLMELHTLSLRHNRVASFAALRPLSINTSLDVLRLGGNKCASAANFIFQVSQRRILPMIFIDECSLLLFCFVSSCLTFPLRRATAGLGGNKCASAV